MRFFSIFFSIAVLRGGNTEYLFKRGREVASSGETDMSGNFIDGELGFGKQLGSSLQAHFSDEISR